MKKAMATMRQLIYGKKFSQASLPSDLQGVICGQPMALYGLTCLVLLGVVILSGFFSGLFGAYGGRIAFTDPPVLSITLLIVLLIVSWTWLWNCVYRGFTNSLWKSFLIALILTFLAAIALQSPIFTGLSLLFNFLALGSISLAFLTCIFSLFLVDSLLKKQTATAKKLIVIAVATISIFVSYQIGQDFPEKSPFPRDYFIPTKLL
ncbi:hypothetical protein Q2T42_19625 [Leptolyngbya boryana CZ1]|uniref:Uncharacterized protein n=1 Tax=Leptolyngbya boryana CZ1 TaxID=3060204 RepID=A0AA96WQI2_LEPBY|nr:hypothetical protein [Leptolyngbya boryana]WNZ44046.1 hypothetical protein Q2T42_19625 [Leptolyngbya boryana CZ1]